MTGLLALVVSTTLYTATLADAPFKGFQASESPLTFNIGHPDTWKPFIFELLNSLIFSTHDINITISHGVRGHKLIYIDP